MFPKLNSNMNRNQPRTILSTQQLQHFGLGIQVFKISSTQNLSAKAKNPKINATFEKALTKAKHNMPSKPLNLGRLPSVSKHTINTTVLVQKQLPRQKDTGIKQSIENPSKNINLSSPIKRADSRSKYGIHPSRQKLSKTSIEADKPSETENKVIHYHHIPNLNELGSFYLKMAEVGRERRKELERLRKGRRSQGSLEWYRMQEIQQGDNLVEDLLPKEICGFDHDSSDDDDDFIS